MFKGVRSWPCCSLITGREWYHLELVTGYVEKQGWHSVVSNHCDLGWNPDVDIVCGLSLLLVLSLALRCYLLGTLVFPLPKNPHFQILISSRTCSRQRASLWLCYCKKHLLILSIKFVVSWACYCWWRYFELMAMAAQVPWLIRLVLFSHF